LGFCPPWQCELVLGIKWEGSSMLPSKTSSLTRAGVREEDKQAPVHAKTRYDLVAIACSGAMPYFLGPRLQPPPESAFHIGYLVAGSCRLYVLHTGEAEALSVLIVLALDPCIFARLTSHQSIPQSFCSQLSHRSPFCAHQPPRSQIPDSPTLFELKWFSL